ncbi:flagellar motor protein [Sulfitobacter sp. JBTF-M27]|uniref:Flagellar motor protein n=2 Tax=Sulfitobacter sediminilitoris TaxID=2698830 RepID=A0A6P0CFI0_9RHOB|nr:flagellar motor protein [Sulfitobacter sediminilitoris]
MTNSQSALIVLIDAEDVRHAFASWPDEICLAACLMRDGDCNMVVFRRDERPHIAERIMDVLRLAARDICFVPQVPGFETRSFRYSDERRLMALVASDPTVLDEAIDYAVNYTYALEEGLDPALVLGLKPRVPAAPVSAPKPVQHSTPAPAPAVDRKSTGELSPLLPEFLRRSAEQARRPRFVSVRKPKLAVLAAQY